MDERCSLLRILCALEQNLRYALREPGAPSQLLRADGSAGRHLRVRVVAPGIALPTAAVELAMVKASLL